MALPKIRSGEMDGCSDLSCLGIHTCHEVNSLFDGWPPCFHPVTELAHGVPIGLANQYFKHPTTLLLDHETVVLKASRHSLEIARVGSVTTCLMDEARRHSGLSSEVHELLEHDASDRPVMWVTLEPIKDGDDSHPFRLDELGSIFGGLRRIIIDEAQRELLLPGSAVGKLIGSVELDGDAQPS